MTERAAVEILVTTELKKALADFKDMHSSLKSIESAANALGNAVKTGLAVFGLDKLVGGLGNVLDSTMAWDDAAMKLTDTMNENAAAATTWLAIGKAVGLESSAIQIAMKTLSVAVSGNSATLREMGIATVDTHGKFLSLNQIVNSAADYFHAHEGATDNAARAVSLFGRNGASLLPILELGSAEIQRLSDHFRNLGYVVNGNVLQGFAMADAQFRDAQMAVTGLGMAVTHALMPGLAALAGGLTDIIEAKMKSFQATIASIVSFIVGFFEGLTGAKAGLSDTAQTLGRVGQAVQGYGDASNKATGAGNQFADAQQRIRDQAKQATDAIERQIKMLEEQTSVENFQDAQRKLHQKLVDDNKKVDQSYSDYQNLILHGYEAAAMDQLVSLQSAQQAAADDSTEIDKGAKQEQRRTLIDQLKDQEKQINDAADKQIAAMQRSAAGMGAAIVGFGNNASNSFHKMGADMALTLDKSSEEAGRKMAENFKKGDWGALGKSIGQGIATGIGDALSKINWGDVFKLVIFRGHVPANPAEWMKFFAGLMPFSGIAEQLGKTIAGNSFGDSGFGKIIRGYADGGIVPGPIGSPQLAVVHGGEMVSKPGQGITINVYGDSPERTAQLVAEKLGQLMAA